MAINCPLCGSDKFRSLWQFKTIQNGCCGHCNHIYSFGAGDVEYNDFGQSYPDDELLNPERSLYDMARYRAERIKHIVSFRGNILEVGCGYGHFISVMRDAGWDAWGIEPSVPASEFARTKHGLSQVRTSEYGTVLGKDLIGKSEFYDVVTVFHVLEHVSDPINFIKMLKNELCPGGLLAVAVPNLFTLQRDFHELYFIARGLHRHTFSPLRLAELLETAGLTVVSIVDEPSSEISASSCLILAVNGDTLPKIELPSLLNSPCKTMAIFHEELDNILINLREHITEWQAAGDRIGIYGGGWHTRAVMELCNLDSNDVFCIIDDDPGKQGTTLNGVDVVGMHSELVGACTRILVSSLTSEDRILARLEKECMNIASVGIYRDLVNIPLN